MAQWLIRFQPDPPVYEAHKDENTVARVEIKAHDTMAFWRAAQMMRANIVRRFEDTEPVFAAHADDQEAVAFAEMLNA
jgi:hypothetical protein